MGIPDPIFKDQRGASQRQRKQAFLQFHHVCDGPFLHPKTLGKSSGIYTGTPWYAVPAVDQL